VTSAGELDQALAALPPWALVLIVLGFFSLIGWIFWLASRD
jgi:hypothetical protein